MSENKEIKISIFKLKEQVAKEPRTLVLKEFFRKLATYILFIPLVLIAIVHLVFTFLLFFLIGKLKRDGLSFKEALDEFDLLKDVLSALSYFKDSIKFIFNSYHLCFKCKNCGNKVQYSLFYRIYEDELPAWQWFNKKRRICYECYKEETK